MKTQTILKDQVPHFWAVFPCSDNEVYYLIHNKWKTLHEIDDLRGMSLFTDKNEAIKYINTHKPPNNISTYELHYGVPYIDDKGEYWFQELKYTTRKLQK